MNSKKIYPFLIFSSVLFILFHSCSDKNEPEEISYCRQLKELGIVDDYQYPVVPGTPEWAEFESHTEKIDACQIPEDILSNMCTYSLISTWLNYPLLVDILAFNIPQMGYESQRSSFNGLAELHNRADVLPEITEFYENFDLQNIVDLWDQDDKFNSIDTQMNFYLTGMMLYQTDIIGQANKKERLSLAEIALKKHNFMRANDYVSWWQAYNSNTTIMARAMLMSDFQPLKQEMTEDDYLGRLIEGGFNHASSVQIDKIVELANQFVSD